MSLITEEMVQEAKAINQTLRECQTRAAALLEKVEATEIKTEHRALRREYIRHLQWSKGHLASAEGGFRELYGYGRHYEKILPPETN